MFRLFSACILLMAALYTPTACDNDTSTARDDSRGYPSAGGQQSRNR